VTLWPWPLTFWPWTVDVHGGSRDQPCHQVWTPYAYPCLIYELQRFPLVTIENANAATAHAPNDVTREYGVKNNYIFGIPDRDLPIHYTTFIGLRRRLRVVYSRAVPCKPFSGHLSAILFYANYKVKTQNSAWELGSSHSAWLSYVKKSRSPLLSQNAPNIHNSKKCV